MWRSISPGLPNMDEGWTRLLLEQYEFPYTSLHNAELRAGQLRDRFDCIVFPSMTTTQILEGQARDATEPQFTGGIGEEGVLRLQEFVAAGGSLVCIDDSCPLPIKYFSIPVRDALIDHKTGKRLDREQFLLSGIGSGGDPGSEPSNGRGAGRRGCRRILWTRWRSTWRRRGRRKTRRNTTRRGGVAAKVVARYADTLVLEERLLARSAISGGQGGHRPGHVWKGTNRAVWVPSATSLSYPGHVPPVVQRHSGQRVGTVKIRSGGETLCRQRSSPVYDRLQAKL